MGSGNSLVAGCFVCDHSHKFVGKMGKRGLKTPSATRRRIHFMGSFRLVFSCEADQIVADAPRGTYG